MDELRLEGVHDDGESLVLVDADGDRHLLTVDQAVRHAVQRTRSTPSRRPQREVDFGPRDIQARFRSGASVEQVVEECGWEPERVRRYQWPILAERGHMARQAQKVELTAPRPAQGYRSAFDGPPLTLSQTVRTHAPELGIAAGSFEWDAWQRPDTLWTVCARFRLEEPADAPRDLVDQEPIALWTFNPASLTVTPQPGWAERLTDPQDGGSPSDGVFGEAPRSPEAPAQSGGGASEPEDDGSTEELLEVLEARRGQRLGVDEDSDDRLAEYLGRSMGRIDQRPRPISAPPDSPVFDHPVQPGRLAAEAASAADDDTGADDGPGPTLAPDTDRDDVAPGAQDAPAPERDSPAPERDSPDPAPDEEDRPRPREATVHRLGRADAGAAHSSPVVEITDDPRDHDESDGSRTGSSRPQDAADDAVEDQDEDSGDRPRHRVGGTRRGTRSSVPTWAEIVFGSKSD